MHFGRRRDEGIALRTRNDVIRQHARAPFENSDKADLGDIQKSASGEGITKAWGGVEIKWRKSWHAAAPIDQERLQMPKSGNAFQPPVRDLGNASPPRRELELVSGTSYEIARNVNSGLTLELTNQCRCNT